jgi:peptide/nickel transport system substrate-binding protein
MSDSQVTRRDVLVKGGASLGLLSLSGLLAACGGSGGGGGPTAVATTGAGTTAAAGGATGGSITWALSADPTFMIPYGATLTETRQATEFIYESLLQWDKDLNIKPALAESYNTPDPKTYEFKLRPGVKFQDGTPFTAKDVVYSINKQLDPPPPGTPDTLSQVPGIAKAVAVDDLTVQIIMKEVDARLPGYLAWGRYSGIVPKGLYENLDPRTAANGTGPFKLTQFRQNDRVDYERNTGYWNPDLPHADKLTLRVLPDEQARIAALRSGDIDGCTISADLAETLTSDANLQVLKGPVAAHREIQFTIKKGPKKPWHDQRVRRAISYAINRQDVIDRVFVGNADLTSVVPPGYGEYPLTQDELKSNYAAYDVDKARSLMQEAGFADGFKVQMQVFTATNDTVKIAQLVQQQLKDIKVELDLKPLEVAVFAKNNGEGNFDMQLTTRGMRGDVSGFVSDFDPASPIYSVWFPGWTDAPPELGKLIHEGFTTLDQAKRIPIYKQIQQIAMDQAVHIPITNPYKFQVVNKRVHDMYVAYTDFNPGLVTATVDPA